MKVLVLAPRYDPAFSDGGYSKHIHEFSETLAKTADTEVVVLSVGDEDKNRRVCGYQFRMLRRFKWFRAVPWILVLMLAVEMRRVRADVIHLQGSAFDHSLVCSVLLAPRGCRRCVTIHGHPAHEGVANGKFRRGSIMYALNVLGERAIVRTFDAVICVTNRRRKEMLQLYGQHLGGKILSLPNGVDEKMVPTLKSSEVEALFAGRWKRSGPRVVQVKALLPYNGQDLLIGAVKKVVAGLPESHLILVGDGWYKSTLENIASQAEVRSHVTFLGKVDNSEISTILEECTVAVMPSNPVRGVEEGSSIALIEYMSFFVPVIASDVGGNSELVIDGVTGILVPPGDVDALAQAILSIWTNPRRSLEMALNAHDYVLKNRTWGQIVGKYYHIYLSLLDRC